MTTVYCSGLDAGLSPSAGLGVARSLREAFADLHIVGVGDTTRCPGVHDPVFDEVWIQPAGDADVRAAAVLRRLGDGAAWISGSEREARRLADVAGGNDGLLSPASTSIACIDAPRDDLCRRLGMLCPAAISAQEEDWQIAAFGREHGWRVWLRGPGHEPARVDGWRTVERLRARLGDRWSAPELRLQAQVDGARESIVFAAHRGAPLGAVHMRAAIETEAGVAGGGHAADLLAVDPRLARALEVELSGCGWTGGGELDIVRSLDGALWLLGARPHFAPWVYGATLAGANLPAALLAAAGGRELAPAAPRGSGFVRVVLEIPVRDGVALPERGAAASGVVRAGNYLSGMPDPGTTAAIRPHPRAAATAPPEALRAIVADLVDAEHTPYAHAIGPAPRWDRLTAAVDDAAGGARVQIAYSIKTDPDIGLLRAARARGFLAEAITAAEVRRAQDAGFAEDEIVLNGPAKGWPLHPSRAFAAFADSLEELQALARRATSGALAARYVGPRLRPPSVASRFGVRLDDFAVFSRLVSALGELPPSQRIGVHFHWASSEAGHETWFETVRATIEWACALQELTGRPVACLDLGGGWQPDDFDGVLLPRLGELVARCYAELDALEVLILEPGRALVQPLVVVETTVLELRERHGAREIVVDAALAEVPRCVWYPHRLLSRGEGGWRHWGRGPDRVVGRLCMEDDVLRTGVAVPDDVRAGTRVLIADAGAYDRSMGYNFGRG